MPRSPRTERPAATGAATKAPSPDDCVIVIFGANGDLARRKLLPGLFHLQQAGLMPDALPDRRLLPHRAVR